MMVVMTITPDDAVSGSCVLNVRYKSKRNGSREKVPNFEVSFCKRGHENRQASRAEQL